MPPAIRITTSYALVKSPIEDSAEMMCLGYRHCPAQTNPEDDSRPLNPQLVCNLEWPKTKFREMGAYMGRFRLADHVLGELAKAVPMSYARLKSV